MKSKRTFVAAATIVALLAIVTAWASRHAGAFTQIESNWRFTTVNVTSLQTARTNVTNQADEPVQVEINWGDVNGDLLVPAIQQVVLPGHTTSSDFSPRSEAGRMEIRPVVKILARHGDDADDRGAQAPRAAGACAAAGVIAVLEVMDNTTHQTSLVYQGLPPTKH